MRSRIALRVFAVLAVLGLAASSLYSDDDDEPKLVLKAPRLLMLSPALAAKGYGKRVEIRARLEGDPETPKELYCLDEVWDWGDGTESVYEPDCDPYEDGTELKRDFFQTHSFGPGAWLVTLALMNGDEVVLHGTVTIRVY